MKRFLLVVTLLFVASFIFHSHAQKQNGTFAPTIPKMWVDAEMAQLEVPLADAASSPKHVSAEYYYRIPIRQIYKNYPVYAPGKEPPGYLEMLKQQEPEIVFDPAKLKTEADWIKAGELVFDAPLGPGSLFGDRDGLYLRELGWYERTRAPITKDGVLPFYRYVITEKGKIGIGILGCAMCHTRVMPDGSIIKGAQGNFPFDRAFADDYRAKPNEAEQARMFERFLYTVPWAEPKLETQLSKMSVEDIALAHTQRSRLEFWLAIVPALPRPCRCPT